MTVDLALTDAYPPLPVWCPLKPDCGTRFAAKAVERLTP